MTAEQPDSTAGGNAPLLRAWITLILLCLINVFSYVDRSLLSLVMPELTKELKLSDTVMGLIAGLPFALCYTLCAVPIAWVADNHNRRNLLAGALAFWSAITFLTGWVQSGWQLALARLGLGAGEAAGHPTSASIIADSFDIRMRTAAFSALAASAFLGPLLGFPVVGWLIADYGWRTAYYAAGGAGLVTALLFLLIVREPVRKQQISPENRLSAFQSLRALLAIPSYKMVILAGGFSAVNHGAHLTWVPTFLDRVHGLGPQEIGVVFGSMRGVTGLAGALFAAVVVGAMVRRDVRWQIRIAVFLGIMPFLTDLLFLFSDDPWVWKTGLATTAFFTAVIHALAYPLYVNVTPSHLRAMGSAVYFLVATLLGLVLGPFLVGAFNDLLKAQYGPGAIAISLAIASFGAIVSTAFLLAGSKTWIRDVERAEGGLSG